MTSTGRINLLKIPLLRETPQVSKMIKALKLESRAQCRWGFGHEAQGPSSSAHEGLTSPEKARAMTQV